MHISPVKTDQDYYTALARIGDLIAAEPGTPQGDELDVLATLVSAYEEKTRPMPAPTPIAAILFLMEQQGLTRKDLEPLIGSRARVSEVLTGKRQLTLAMVRKLHNGLGISADLLIASNTVPPEKRKPAVSRPLRLKQIARPKPPQKAHRSTLS